MVSLLMLWWCQSLLANVNVIAIDDELQFSDLQGNAQYVRTPANLQLSQIRTQPLQWQNYVDIAPLNETESLWGKASFRYSRQEVARYTFLIRNGNLDFVDVFIVDHRGRIKLSVSTGASRPFASRPINYRDFAIPFELSYGERFDIYFRIKDEGPLVFSAEFWKSTALIEKVQGNITLIGAFTGALVILACYFLVTYLMLHSAMRFWFATANLVFLFLFLNIEGILGQFTGFTRYMLPFTLILLSAAVFCSTKISNKMLVGVPTYWRRVNYIAAFGFLGIVLVNQAYWQIVMAAGLGGAILLLQLVLSIVYRNPFSSLPNRVFIAGWATISLVSLLHVSLFLTGTTLETADNLLLNLVLMTGILMIAVAIEAHEKILISSQYEQQKSTIENLQQFYDFFRNSAEGLYSTTPDGRLISVNPAMCTIFGYKDEDDLISNIENAAQFYADSDERELVIGQLLQQGSVSGKEVKGLRKDGTEFWFSMSVQMREDNGNKLLFGSIVDITKRKQSDISLRYMATHDSLTGVYNRRHFEAKLIDYLSKKDEDDFELTLLYLDLDQFKTVNDSCGHKAGDVLIKQLAQRLNDVVAHRGMLGRMGGDEFSVMLSSEHAASGMVIAHQLLNVVRDYRFVWDNRIFTLGVSIGLVEYHADIHNAEQLMSMADSACYLAKQQGRDQIHVYSREDARVQEYEADLDSISLINDALEHHHFVLYYQHYNPLQKMKQGYHYEILLRIQKDNGELIPPIAFLPAAERYNLSARIDRWVLESYLRWLAENPAHLTNLTMANINLSGVSLADGDLKLFFLNAFEKYAIPYHKICFEITESMAIVKLHETLEFINTFHDLGCKFALDDFGIGFSSYEHLKKLPVDYVKIDGSFVKDILVDPIDMAMVGSMKDVAQAMGIETVAEYVESAEIMTELGKIGVDYAQGYGVSKPAPLAAFSEQNTIEK
ncbi:MAG: EAL domain-containing protein [Aestuariibacter sp.]